MKPIDPNALFSIFEYKDEDIYQEAGASEILDNPYVLMGMVLRGIENWMMMDELCRNKYPEQYREVRNSIRKKYNDRLDTYLIRIDIDREESIYKIGESFPKVGIANGLNHLIRYYERYEEYEKCGVIKKYLDKILMAELEVMF